MRCACVTVLKIYFIFKWILFSFFQALSLFSLIATYYNGQCACLIGENSREVFFDPGIVLLAASRYYCPSSTHRSWTPAARSSTVWLRGRHPPVSGPSRSRRPFIFDSWSWSWDLPEPNVQQFTGEILSGASVIAEDGARLDIAENGFWGGRFDRVYFDGVFNPHALSVRQQNLISTYRMHVK